jgi:hypothetical protein
MWMDSYVQDTLIRARLAEAEHEAARRHLLRLVRQPRAGARRGGAVRRLVESTSLPRLKRLLERMALS